MLARQKCQLHTGLWFVTGDQFQQWRSAPNSLLWLFGIRKNPQTIYLSGV